VADQRLDRAARYRALAEEIRTAAEGMQTESRGTLLRLANDYDLLATKLEAIETRVGKKAVKNIS
jgi:hypothetical protein